MSRAIITTYASVITTNLPSSLYKAVTPRHPIAMLGMFRKKSLRTSFFPRDDRTAIDGDVFIKRVGVPTLRVKSGNISNSGLYLQIPGHDLERGKKVELILVSNHGQVRRISRLMGIVIRIEEGGVAMVTYKKDSMNTKQGLSSVAKLLKQEFGQL